MNQNKVGKFIATCRKERNMTQQELANQLHVTDRAISNWENGRRIPDVSFFKPLCAIFDISVNELMNGEKLKKEKDIASTNERLIHTLHVSNKKIVNIIRVFLFCLFLSFFILLLLVFLLGLLQLDYLSLRPGFHSRNLPFGKCSFQFGGR